MGKTIGDWIKLVESWNTPYLLEQLKAMGSLQYEIVQEFSLGTLQFIIEQEIKKRAEMGIIPCGKCGREMVIRDVDMDNMDKGNEVFICGNCLVEMRETREMKDIRELRKNRKVKKIKAEVIDILEIFDM